MNVNEILIAAAIVAAGIAGAAFLPVSAGLRTLVLPIAFIVVAVVSSGGWRLGSIILAVATFFLSPTAREQEEFDALVRGKREKEEGG